VTSQADDLRLVDVFRCPGCGGDLDARNNTLVCRSDGSAFDIVRGLPRFVSDLDSDVQQVQAAFDFEHRRFADSEHTVFGPHLVEQFLGHVGLPASFFRGKRCLDVGCGSGRWTYALAELGADVVAVDLTLGGIEATYVNLGKRPNVTAAQADIFKLPFNPESFDFVMSWGVLHHTPSTKRAFDRIVPLVKPGGTLFVMVYDVDQGRGVFLTNVIRWIMRRMSDQRRYDFCRHLLIRNPRLFNVLNKHMIVVYYDPRTSPLKASTLQFGIYDAYSPRYNFLHSRREVADWFRGAGFSDMTVIDSPRGAVEVRGTRSA
jgi:SAM-dependent methyltransferase